MPFAPPIQNAIWEQKFAVLKRFGLEHGHFRVSTADEFQVQEGNELVSFKLRLWIDNQKRLYRERKLAQNRIQKLEQIGFTLETTPRIPWDERIQHLTSLVAEHGSLENALEEANDNESLERWLTQQGQKWSRKERNKLKKNEKPLTNQQIKSLEAIGFCCPAGKLMAPPRKNVQHLSP